MKIHYQNSQGEEVFIDNVVHLQNIDNETVEVLLGNGKTLKLRFSRIEGIYDGGKKEAEQDDKGYL